MQDQVHQHNDRQNELVEGARQMLFVLAQLPLMSVALSLSGMLLMGSA